MNVLRPLLGALPLLAARYCFLLDDDASAATDDDDDDEDEDEEDEAEDDDEDDGTCACTTSLSAFGMTISMVVAVGQKRYPGTVDFGWSMDAPTESSSSRATKRERERQTRELHDGAL